MLRKNYKGLIIGLILGIMFSNAIAFAAPLYKTIEVVYNGIKINIDGNEITPKDANGNVVEPFNYNGTVYLPVRAVGEALGKDVAWDANTQTVFLKPKSQATIAPTAPPVVDTTPSIQAKTFKDRLEKSDSVNTYDFTLQYPSRVTLDFTHDYVDSGSKYWKITFIAKKYDEKIIEVYSQGNVIQMPTSYDAFLPTGDYYAKVEPWEYSNVDYTLKINYERNIGQFEIESNNIMDTANQISINKPITGNLITNNDIDYFKFTVNSKTDVYIDFAHNYVDSGSNYWKITILEKNNNKKLEFYAKGNEVTQISDKATLDAGEYYAKVEPWEYSNVDYTLTITTK